MGSFPRNLPGGRSLGDPAGLGQVTNAPSLGDLRLTGGDHDPGQPEGTLPALLRVALAKVTRRETEAHRPSQNDWISWRNMTGLQSGTPSACGLNALWVQAR